MAHVLHQLLLGFQNQAGLNRMALCVPPSMDRFGTKADDGSFITPNAGDEEWSGPRLFYTLEQDQDQWRHPQLTDGPAFNFLLPDSVVGGRHPSLVSCDAIRCLPYGVGADEFDALLRQIAGGRYEVVAIDLSNPGSAGGRDPAMLARSAARRLIKACDRCERRHPELGRPTLLVMLPPRGNWIDGSPAGISDREFVEDHFSAWLHAERWTKLNTPRWSPESFFRSSDGLVPPKVVHDYAFTAWRDGMHAKVNASFLVFAKDEAALRGGVRVGDWDRAGRLLDLLDLRDAMPDWLRELSLEDRRRLLLTPEVWDALRTWLRGKKIPPTAPAWIRNLTKNRRPAPSPYGLRSLQPAGGAADSAQEHWRIGHGNEIRVAGELGLKLVPGSGSGAVGGDADNSAFVAEIKHTREADFRIHGEDDLDKIARTALARQRLPLFVVVFAAGGRVMLAGESGDWGAELETKTVVVRPGVELEPFRTRSDPSITWRMISKEEVADVSESSTLIEASCSQLHNRAARDRR